MTPTELIEGNVAMVFPGQGSQFVGMGTELQSVSPAARAIFAEADALLSVPLSSFIAEGPADVLEDTINAQPAILTASVAALAAVRERLEVKSDTITPLVVAGHSMGEFTALVAAGALDFPSALTLVRERGRLMKEAGIESPGGMAAVLGLDDETLAAACAEASSIGIVVIANANCPGQIVISGEVAALERAMQLAKERGAKRVTRLGISIASHSPLMANASRQFAEVVRDTDIKVPTIPVIANVTAQPLRTAAEIRTELSYQIERPVNWTGSVRTMVDHHVDTVVELGPGAVLSGLIKRITIDVRTLTIADLGLDLPGLGKPA
ncbi:MAG: ACP S-malonyltransferase [Thermomicrobiales bacterium]